MGVVTGCGQWVVDLLNYLIMNILLLSLYLLAVVLIFVQFINPRCACAARVTVVVLFKYILYSFLLFFGRFPNTV